MLLVALLVLWTTLFVRLTLGVREAPPLAVGVVQPFPTGAALLAWAQVRLLVPLPAAVPEIAVHPPL